MSTNTLPTKVKKVKKVRKRRKVTSESHPNLTPNQILKVNGEWPQEEIWDANAGVYRFQDRALSPAQHKVWVHPSRFRVAVCGRRFGKTLVAVNELIRAAQAGPNKLVWYLAPTYKMAKGILWRMLKDALSEKGISVSVSTKIVDTNETELTATLTQSGSRIVLRGCENEDDLRGYSLNFVVFDEVQDISMEVIDTIVRPAMGDKMAHGLYIGTPKGMGDNTIYRLYLRGTTEPDWESWVFTTEQGGNMPIAEIESAKRVVSLTKFKQEYLASFEAVQGRVLYNFDAVESVGKYIYDYSTEPPTVTGCEIFDNGTDLHIGMDFNVAKMTAVAGIKVNIAGQKGLHVIKDFVIENANTRLMCETIKEAFPGRKITVYPDPSGRARKTSAEVGQTDFAIIREFGFRLIAPSRAPLIVDSVNDLNALLKNAVGDRLLLVHPDCREVIRCLDGLLYKEGTSQPDKDSGLDHMVDGLRYLVSSQFSSIRRTMKITKLDTVH